MFRSAARLLMMLCLSLALGGGNSPSPAWAQRPASTFAEIDHWQRVRGSTDPSALRSYLDKYPEGEFAPEARDRLRQLGTPAPTATPSPAPAPARPPAPAPVPQRPAAAPQPPAVVQPPAATQPASVIPPGAPAATVELTPAAIREVQQLLYDRGYGIRKVDGKSIDELKLAITHVQRQLNQPQNGNLTNAQLTAIRRVTPNTNWTAIAYTGEGASFSVLNRTSRTIAEEEAMMACKKRTGRECHIRSTSGKFCVALSYGVGVSNRTRMHTTATGADTEIETAKEASLVQCRGLSRFPNSCTIKSVACADGRSEAPAAAKGKKRRS